MIDTDTRYVTSRSATGMVHAMTLEGRDVTGSAVCGSVATMPTQAELEAPGVDAPAAAEVLNDLHLDGPRPVCERCRARVAVAATREQTRVAR